MGLETLNDPWVECTHVTSTDMGSKVSSYQLLLVPLLEKLGSLSHIIDVLFKLLLLLLIKSMYYY